MSIESDGAGVPAPAADGARLLAFGAAGLWPGASAALLRALAERGLATPRQISIENLLLVPKMTRQRAGRLYSAWVAAQPEWHLASLLLDHGLSLRPVRRVLAHCGVDAAELLRDDPWQIVPAGMTVPEADEFAAAIEGRVEPADPRRLRAVVHQVLGDRSRRGHTVVPRERVIASARDFGLDAVDAATAVDAAVTAGVAMDVSDASEPGSEASPADSGQLLSRSDLGLAEQSIADDLRRLQRTATPLADEAAARAAAGGLDETQRGAVAHTAAVGVTVLTGGPGTGKSATVAAVVALCADRGLSLALAAPTGRAAKRLAELSGDDAAMTIHRLLGARRPEEGGRTYFERGRDAPIEAEVVVVDEASMLDVPLAAALLAALADGTHLLLVGDPAQLPSIGPGRVLADVLAAGVFPVVELTTLYRQAEGGAIARLASAVRAGSLGAPDEAGHETVVVAAPDSATAARRVCQLVTDSIPRVFSLRGEQIQVVTPMHRGPAGTVELNVALKAELNPGPGVLRGFDEGDRVVATANHLEAQPVGFANGEVGTVIEVDGRSLTVEFPGGPAEIKGRMLDDLTHGWAITVHRAQGSEWEAVVVVLPAEASGMLSRPLVYTAFTRARTHLSVVHSAGRRVGHAVAHIGARPRRTRLEQLLRA